MISSAMLLLTAVQAAEPVDLISTVLILVISLAIFSVISSAVEEEEVPEMAP